MEQLKAEERQQFASLMDDLKALRDNVLDPLAEKLNELSRERKGSIGERYGLKSSRSVQVTITVPPELVRLAHVCGKSDTSTYLSELFMMLLGERQAAREIRLELKNAGASPEDVELFEDFLARLQVHLFKAKTKVRNDAARAAKKAREAEQEAEKLTC